MASAFEQIRMGLIIDSHGAQKVQRIKSAVQCRHAGASCWEHLYDHGKSYGLTSSMCCFFFRRNASPSSFSVLLDSKAALGTSGLVLCLYGAWLAAFLTLGLCFTNQLSVEISETLPSPVGLLSDLELRLVFILSQTL